MNNEDALYAPPQRKLSIEQQYLEDTKPTRFKFPIGESYIEFLSDGERKQITFKEGDLQERMTYRINGYDRLGLKLAEGVEFPMPKTVLDAIHELRSQNGGSVVGAWLKVKREGTDKTSTKYQAYPLGKRPVF